MRIHRGDTAFGIVVFDGGLVLPPRICVRHQGFGEVGVAFADELAKGAGGS